MLPAAQMSHPEVALCEGQEMNSTTASEDVMEASNLSGSLLRSSPTTLGSKRRRALSSPEPVRKRPSLLPEPAPTPEPLKPLLAESNWHCSKCGIPCWGCFTRPEVPPDLASLNEEKDTNRLKMSSSPPTERAVSTQSGTTQNTTSTSSTKKRKYYEELGLNLVGPRDSPFKDRILNRLGVRISLSAPVGIAPKDIFGKQELNPKSRVILNKGDDELMEIALDFAQWKRRSYDEDALTLMCSDSIVPRDRWIGVPKSGEDQSTRPSVRRDRWKPRKEGPSIPSGEYIYDWDLEPDTTYGVSIRMFDVEHRWELQHPDCHPWLAESESMVCPYLTIAYKCTEKAGKSSHATYQNAAASILWLYQRKRIREALKLKLDGLKHFSVSIVDEKFTIWQAGFQSDFYYLHEVANCDATSLDGLKCYIEWNNAIHTWGLGANADSFKKDIEALLEKRRSRKPLPTPPSTLSPADAPQQSGAV